MDEIVDQDLFLKMNLRIRNGSPGDHSRVLAVMPEWWGGRDLSSGLLKLFFIHFHDTIFIAERNSELAGFLVGFLSQSNSIEAYVHLLGVHPDLRKQGIARTLYECFFDLCRKRGRSLIRACTSPVNVVSIEFHRKMGFQIEPGEKEIEGVPVTLDYLRENEPKVLFAKSIG